MVVDEWRRLGNHVVSVVSGAVESMTDLRTGIRGYTYIRIALS